MLNRSVALIMVGFAVLLESTVAMAQSLAPAPLAANSSPPSVTSPMISDASMPSVTAPSPVGVPCAQTKFFSQTTECQSDTQKVPFTPFMLGDFIGLVANQFSDVKIAEGESPLPMDRVFYKFNWYNNVDPTRWTSPLETIHNVNLYREVFGFEKAFFDEKISIGLRLPFNSITADAKHDAIGEQGLDATYFGNVSAIFKGVLWEDRHTGSVLSGGVTLSLPTANNKLLNPGQSTLTYVQPFGGFILNQGDFFVQGFVSITAPIASAESIVLFADLGVGYWMYRNTGGDLLTGFAPTIEMHWADPLRQSDPSVNDFGLFDGLKLHNVLDFTAGGTFEFANNTTLGFGIAVPVTGPRPFDVEAIAQLNYRF